MKVVYYLTILMVYAISFSACNGTPGSKVVEQVKESQPTGIKPLKDVSTDYPAYLLEKGLTIPAKTTVMEAGKQDSRTDASAYTVKLISSRTIQDLYEYYRNLVSNLSDFKLTTDKYFHQAPGAEGEATNRFILYALNGKNYLMIAGSPAYGAAEKTQITIGYRLGQEAE